MEEGSDNNQPSPAPKKKRPFYGKLPETKKKYGHRIEKGGNKKTSKTYKLYKDSGATNLIKVFTPAPSAVTSTAPNKQTKAEIFKKLAYTQRDKSNSDKKMVDYRMNW
eukprot:12828943-Ditylum_brightwellii.AAC.1